MLLFSIMTTFFLFALITFAFFVFDEIILRGYFATKLRKRFNVDDLKGS